MDKLTSIKIMYEDGTYSDQIPISGLAQNIEWDSSHSLVDILGNVNISAGSIQYQINQLINNKMNITDLNSYIANHLNADVTDWLESNVQPVGSAVVVDSSLSISGAAADSQKTGVKIEELNNNLEVEKSRIFNLQKNKLLFPIAFEVGNIFGNGKLSEIKYRIRSKQLLSINGYETYLINSGFRVKIFRYSKDTQGILSSSDWLTDSFYLGPNYLYKMVIARIEEQQDVNENANLSFFLNQVYKSYIDKTLTVADVPADAKTVGDKQAELDTRLVTIENKLEELDELEELNNNLEVERLRIFNLQKNKLLLPIAFEVGNILGNGKLSEIKYRIRSKQLLSVDDYETYLINSGFRVKIFRYSKDTQGFLSSSDWLTDSFYLGPNYLYKMVIARIEEEQNTQENAILSFFLNQVYRSYVDKTLTVADVPADAKAVGDKQAELDTRITIIENESDLQAAIGIKNKKFLFPSSFKNGDIDNNGVEIDINYRVCSSDFITFKNYTIYKIETDYKIQIHQYNIENNAYVHINNSEWIENGFYIFYPNYIYKIVIAKNEEDINQIANIAFFTQQVYQLFPFNNLILDTSFKTTYLGTTRYYYGWALGYFNQYGNPVNNSKCIRTVTPKYRPDEMVQAFHVKVLDNYTVSVVEYNQSGQVTNFYGTSNPSSANLSKQLLIIPTPGSAYSFSIGGFSEDVLEQTLLDGNFLNSIITITAYRDKKNNFIKKQLRDKHLNILIFGNSYSGDSWGYVPFLLKKYGITVNIYIYYRGSGSIDRLLAEWEDRSDSGLDPFGRSHVRGMAHIDTRYSPNTWDTSVAKGYCAKDILEFVNDSNKGIDKWDIISLQQGGREQHFTKAPGGADPRNGIQPYLRKVINLIRQSYSKNHSLAWFESYTAKKAYAGNEQKGYPSLSAEEGDDRIGILKATETIFKAEPFDLIIPSGAAVFNGRTNAELASINVSAVGNLWCPDVVHLDAGIPAYISACTVVESIFRKFFPNLSILGDDTRITDELIANWHCPFVNNWQGPVKTTDETLYHLAQKCAINACNNPFDFTPIYSPNDTTELAMFDTHSDRYWADSLIDTSHIIDGVYVE